jgi:hypothetical protein
MIHGGEAFEFGAEDIFGEALLGEDEVAGLVEGHEFTGQLIEGLLDLRLNAAAHARGTQEETVEDAADVVVEVEGGADDAAALEFPEGPAGPAQDEEEKDDVAEPIKREIACQRLGSLEKGERCGVGYGGGDDAGQDTKTDNDGDSNDDDRTDKQQQRQARSDRLSRSKTTQTMRSRTSQNYFHRTKDGARESLTVPGSATRARQPAVCG